jgi:hypothetical protein
MRQRRWMMLGLVLASSVMAQTLDKSTQNTINSLIDELKTNYLFAKKFDWEALRSETLETARKTPNGQEPRAAIMGLLETINDPAIVVDEWLTQGQEIRRRDFGEIGIRANAETRLIYEVFAGGAAAQAGLRVGDEIIAINNKPPKIQGEHVYSSGKVVPITVKRNEQILEIKVSVSTITAELALKVSPMRAGRLGRAAYLEPDRSYLFQRANRIQMATSLQFALRNLEQSGACGYVFDFRRVQSNLMASISGFGPLLTSTTDPLLRVGSTERSDPISYDPRSGDTKIDVSIVAGLSTRPWQPQRPDAPIVVLTSAFTDEDWLPLTFVGRPKTHLIGEARGYSPFAYSQIDLSDAAYILFPSGYVLDRLGHQYEEPLEVDETISTDWPVFGTKNDAVIQAAQTWLESQPACK